MYDMLVLRHNSSLSFLYDICCYYLFAYIYACNSIIAWLNESYICCYCFAFVHCVQLLLLLLLRCYCCCGMNVFITMNYSGHIYVH